MSMLQIIAAVTILAGQAALQPRLGTVRLDNYASFQQNTNATER